jgi:hypothetical protein
MKFLKENLAAIILSTFALYIMYISSSKANVYKYEIEKHQREMDSIQRVNDSLSFVISDELLSKEIELGRYEVAFQIFMERNPKAAEQYATIISDETE